MNKIFVLALLAMTIFGTSVYAQETQDQDTRVNINTVITVQITPELLDFGNVAPGGTGTASDITFDTGTTNSAVLRIEVTGVANFPFEDGLMFGGFPAFGQFREAPCVFDEAEGCTYNLAPFVPTLEVPSNAPAGVADGLITYTVTGPTPE